MMGTRRELGVLDAWTCVQERCSWVRKVLDVRKEESSNLLISRETTVLMAIIPLCGSEVTLGGINPFAKV